jgi:hypothetical protein
MEPKKEMSTLDTWKYLQDNEYFEKHHYYNHWQPHAPEWVRLEDIQGKVVVEIGGGYGRQTVFFGKLASKVYMIEVSPIIIQKAGAYVAKHKLSNVEFILAEKVYEMLPIGLDYGYSYLVFQHITPMQCQEYISTVYDRLQVGGKVNFQFRIGDVQAYCKNLEPIVCYQLKDISRMMKQYKILNAKRVDEHLFIYGIKE